MCSQRRSESPRQCRSVCKSRLTVCRLPTELDTVVDDYPRVVAKWQGMRYSRKIHFKPRPQAVLTLEGIEFYSKQSHCITFWLAIHSAQPCCSLLRSRVTPLTPS